jgi:hypothetical protein
MTAAETKAILALHDAMKALPNAVRALTSGDIEGLALPRTDGIVMAVRAVDALLAEIYRNHTTAAARSAALATRRKA